MVSCCGDSDSGGFEEEEKGRQREETGDLKYEIANASDGSVLSHSAHVV